MSDVTLTIDGEQLTVPAGTLVIRAAELLGIQIPRFCDHPLLDPLGACRQCLVEIEGQRKPFTSCTTTVAEGMVVRTQLTSEVARQSQEGVLELLLLNHPLDCPICDKGGECPLQDQTLANGPAESRFVDRKRVFPKPIAISSQVLLDRERCVLCARCTRFSQQIAGDPFIELFERGALEQVAIYEDEPFESYFSGNTIQICPVGALTGTSYRFRARPFDLVSSSGACEHCASGCALRVDSRRNTVLRRLAGSDPDVNEEWNCDKGRWAFTYATQPDRLRTPLVRAQDGRLREASWSEALERAAGGLRAAIRSGVLIGGRLALEDAYAYAKFARVALRTNNIDFRTRAGTEEEAAFLARIAGRHLDVTYADLDVAPAVLLAGLEPEDESPIVHLRLRKAVRSGAEVFAVTPLATDGLRKLAGRALLAAPGTEAAVLDALSGGKAAGDLATAAGTALRAPGSVILVGERLSCCPGALSAALRLAEATGAKLAWVPRRAGDRGALEAGAFPTLLPGGRPVGDATARAEVEAVWGAALPDGGGLGTGGMLAAAAAGGLDAVLVAGVDANDLPDPAGALVALDRASFLVSLELRASAITDLAHVVLPVAAMAEKAGSFVNWEGRTRTFDPTLRQVGLSLADHAVLAILARQMGVDLGFDDVAGARAELASLGRRPGADAAVEAETATPLEPQEGEALLADWPWLLDSGRMQDGEPNLAGTARAARAYLSATTAKEIGVEPGTPVTVSTDRGSVTVPVQIGEMPDRVVVLPANSPGCTLRRSLVADTGAVVRLAPGAADDGSAE